jgi:hypothetical protein
MTAPRAWLRPIAATWALLQAVLPAASTAATPYAPFPSEASLRKLQLAALACARENTAADCEQTQRLGDPLLDHPRLPATCKDLIWQMLQKAQPASSNSFARRQAIDEPAARLLLLCRSAEKPEPAAAPAAKPSGGGGINFGGG